MGEESDVRWKVAQSLRSEDRIFVQVMVGESVVRCPDVINQRNRPHNFVSNMGVEGNVCRRVARKLLVEKPSFVPPMAVESVVNSRDAIVWL
jgi:hypothetical protein